MPEHQGAALLVAEKAVRIMLERCEERARNVFEAAIDGGMPLKSALKDGSFLGLMSEVTKYREMLKEIEPLKSRT